MNKTTPSTVHLTDGELVRYLDHEVAEGERRELMRHLSTCDACAERLQSISDRSREVGRRIAALHTDVRADELTRARALAAARNARRGRASSGMRHARVAAVAAVVTLGTLTVQPVRAWLVDRWDALTGDQVAAPMVTIPHTIDASGSKVSFLPAGNVFILELENLQASGTLTIHLGAGEQASAQIMNGAGENLLVLPAGIRIENREDSHADYRLTLPSNLRRVQVIAGDTPIAIIPVEGQDDTWTRTVPLHRED